MHGQSRTTRVILAATDRIAIDGDKLRAVLARG
jgi:hypothetical protein